MKKIEIDANVGDEIAVAIGDKTLILKVGEKTIIPDFVESFTQAFMLEPYRLIYALERLYHHEYASEQKVRSVLSEVRERLFNSVPKSHEEIVKGSVYVEEQETEATPADETIAEENASVEKNEDNIESTESEIPSTEQEIPKATKRTRRTKKETSAE